MLIDEFVIEYLAEDIGSDIGVYAEVPEAPGASFIVVDRVGGSMLNHINSASLAIQSYGPTKLEAARLNERVKSSMLNIINHKEIASCKLTNDYNFTNVTTKKHRYQAVFDLVHYL